MKTRIIIAGVIENSKGEILIGQKPKNDGVYPNTWHIPGGGIEENERIEDGLKREVKEETNLEVSDIQPVHFSDDVTNKVKDGISQEVHMIFIEFRCKAKSDVFSAGDDLEVLKWVSKSELKDYKLTPPGEKLFKFLDWI